MTDNCRGGKVTSLLVMETRLKRHHPTIVKCLLVHYSAACLIFVKFRNLVMYSRAYNMLMVVNL
jgi:hypothetical protein